MYKLFVAVRYLRRNWLNLVGVAAVAIAVMVPICVLSVMKGFDDEIRSRSRDTLSDLIVDPGSNDSFGGYEDLIARIEKLPHVLSAAPEYAGLAIVRIGKQTRYAQFRGIQLDKELRSTDFAHYYRSWRAQEARNDLTSILTLTGSRPGVPDAETVKALASRLREKDFKALPRRHRRVLKEYAKATHVDLSACFRNAESAMPKWIAVANPKREAPAFIGSEMAIIGRRRDGGLNWLEKGGELILIIPTEVHDSTRVFQRCRVSGYFKSGLYDYDQHTIVLPLEAIQKRLRKPGHVTSINIRLDDFANAPATRAALWGLLSPAELSRGFHLMKPILKGKYPAIHKVVKDEVKFLRDHASSAGGDTIRQVSFRLEYRLLSVTRQELADTSPDRLSEEEIEELREFEKLCATCAAEAIAPNFRISTWHDKRRNFLRAVQVEQRVMAFILFFVTIVAGFLIFSILHTTVHVKTKDIGILKAIGGTMQGIMGLFLLNGLFIALIGSVMGAIGGLLITKYLNEIETMLSRMVGFRLFPRDIYYLDQIPVDKDPVPSAIFICITALTISFLASALPAWKAARLDPVEALRYE